MPDLRVVSYNVRSLRDDVGALVDVVTRLAPDVLCVQEAPRFLRWRHHLADLAERTGLLVACGGRTTGGPALLTSLRVEVLRTHEWRFAKAPGRFQRGAAVAEARVGGRPFVAVSTHYSLDPVERRRHTDELLGRLNRLGQPAAGPAVLAGDLNETDDAPAWRTLVERRFRDAFVVAPRGSAPTFPAAGPARRIDGILVDPAFEVLGCGVPDELDHTLLARATDHLPVVADLRLG
ncbi:MAG: endonuclease/exonuclease/phosphatase family protein [Motilibacteraceae bacterium]